MRNLLCITLLMSVSLACGVATLPENNVVDANPTSQVVVFTPTQIEPEMSMIVTAETLRIRTGAGEEFSAVGELQNGQIVTCSDTKPAKDGGMWCKHELGWSNIRYMVQK